MNCREQLSNVHVRGMCVCVYECWCMCVCYLCVLSVCVSHFTCQHFALVVHNNKINSLQSAAAKGNCDQSTHILRFV